MANDLAHGRQVVKVPVRELVHILVALKCPYPGRATGAAADLNRQLKKTQKNYPAGFDPVEQHCNANLNLSKR
jgi:hypothetical protein